MALYLQGIAHHPDEDDDEAIYQPEQLKETICAAFAFGCAVGVGFADHILPILEQTHPGEVEEILQGCVGPLADQIAEARNSPTEMAPAVFLESIIEHIDGSESVDEEAVYNLISMSFEYGCVVAHLERTAALVVRNHYNRSQAEAVASFESGESANTPPGPDPHASLQSLAAEVITAYEKDISPLSRT